MEKSVAVVYFSGYGHTEKVAHAVIEGVEQHVAAHLITVDQEGNIADADWQTLSQSQAILFGSPTYMGGVAWQFKKFADASSKVWYQRQWKDKLVGAFTNSASINGDKLVTLQYLFTLAMQHGMIWIGADQLPSNKLSADRNDINYLGCFMGVMTQSPSDAGPDIAPPAGDLATAKRYGERVAQLTLQYSPILPLS